MQLHVCVVAFFASNIFLKNERKKPWFLFLFKQKKRKRITQRKKNAEERVNLSSLAFTFGMKHSFCLFLSMFLQP
jgi:hypothetical protein